MTPTLRVKRLTETAVLPAYARPGDAGMDLVADEECFIAPGDGGTIGTGIAVEIPDGYEGQVRPRSGLSRGGRVAVLGTVDSGYRGEVKVIVLNHGPSPWWIRHGDRIAQLVISPVARCAVVEAEELSESERGAAGFGSTGLTQQAPRGCANEVEGGAGEGEREIVQQEGTERVGWDSECPEPWRKGRHEWYGAPRNGFVCRACGARSTAPGWDANGSEVR